MSSQPAPISATGCRHCGKPLDEAFYLAQNGEYCCENCHLDATRCCEHGLVDDLYAKFAETLAAALDLRELETGQHSKRVACHTLVLAKRLAFSSAELRQLYWGALLHDIGKIGIPDAILLKHGALTSEEWNVMQTHPAKGYELVAAMPGMAQAAEIVLSHEERFDGKGYPRRLRGTEIPLGARLFAVIDTLDAMTSDRPYRKALDFTVAKAEICKQSGLQFDPLAVEAFLAEQTALEEMVALKCSKPLSAPRPSESHCH